MASYRIAWILLLILPIVVFTTNQDGIIEVSLPNAGTQKIGAKRIPYYRSVMDLADKKQVRFAVKATQCCQGAANLLFSEKQASTIIYNTDHDYFEITLPFNGNDRMGIRVGAMKGSIDYTSTPNIWIGKMFTYFWAYWSGNVIKVGYGLNIGQDVLMEKSFPPTIDINYLALFNGYGSGADWRIFTGIYY